MNRLQQQGVSLIELIIFLVVSSIVVVSMLSVHVMFAKVLGSGNVSNTELYETVTETRMNMILQRRRYNGFDSVADPCGGGVDAPGCNLPSGHSIVTTLDNSVSNQIQVTIVLRDSNAQEVARKVMRLYNYEGAN